MIPVGSLEVAIDGTMAMMAAGSTLPWERRLRISRLQREIRVRGSLTEDQRALLLRAAEACPVDGTLRSSVQIETVITNEF